MQNTQIDPHNHEQQLAYELVANTNSSFFLTGRAGTGKTTFLHNVQKLVGKQFITLAPTGVAAILAGGDTIHSFFGLPMEVCTPGTCGKMNEAKILTLLHADTIIIDEVSMVRCDIMDAIDYTMRKALRNNMPFGGKQIIFVGDMFQLPPVVKQGPEKDMLKVGYGAMILESLLAVLALCVAGAAAAADGTPAAGTPFQIFSRGVAGFFEMFGVPAYAATVFMTMCVSALALTSLDAVARIGRMSFQELFSVDDMEHAEGWRKLLCNVYFSTFITLVFGFILTKIGYANIWPLFGSANQLLSALVLSTLCVFLKVTGRSNKMLFPPLIIMLCVTFTALVQRLMAMVKAISNAAAVTIPAGETTWGAVFIANGLQLILAVLLIVLGLNIVFHSFSAYKKAEHNSEAKA